MTEDLYSKNRLVNPSAEDGLTGWSVSNVDVVDGGIDGSKCFRLAPTASMSQIKIFPVQPPDFKVAVDFLPEYEQPENSTDVKAVLKVTYEYSDGSTDVFILPCRDDTQGVV
jgi:hypothetical protein